MMVICSLQAGKLLPYQRYLLYKPVLKHRDVFYHSKGDATTCDTENAATNCDTAMNSSEIINSMFETNSTNESNSSSAHAHASVGVSINTGYGTEESGCSSVAISPTTTIGNCDDGSSTSSQLMLAENRKRVQEFYNHSRLHYISTWCSESKAFVAALQNVVPYNPLILCNFIYQSW